mgnify:CR=1 FL=1
MDDSMEFDALLFGAPDQGSVNYFQQQYSNVIQNAGQFVGDIGKMFVEKAQYYYNNYVSEDALRRVRNILQNVDEMNQSDIIRQLIDFSEFQHADLVMQRWIMAMPEVRTRYHEQTLDGYSNTYVDMAPDDCGFTHRDWRMVTDGMLNYTYDEEGEVNGLHYAHHLVSADLEENERALEIDEKDIILSTWDALGAYLKSGRDPTNVFDEA